MVDLEDAAGSPPPATCVAIWHIAISTSTTGRLCAHVVGDGAREENWGRQFGGVYRGFGWIKFCRRRGCADPRLSMWWRIRSEGMFVDAVVSYSAMAGSLFLLRDNGSRVVCRIP
jgi:hypothetical protein